MSHRLLWKVNAGQLRILVLVLVLAVAFFFRFYQIGQVPPGLNPDEATHALDAYLLRMADSINADGIGL